MDFAWGASVNNDAMGPTQVRPSSLATHTDMKGHATSPLVHQLAVTINKIRDAVFISSAQLIIQFHHTNSSYPAPLRLLSGHEPRGETSDPEEKRTFHEPDNDEPQQCRTFQPHFSPTTFPNIPSVDGLKEEDSLSATGNGRYGIKSANMKPSSAAEELFT